MWRIATKSHEMQSPKSLLQRSGASISIDGCVKLEKLGFQNGKNKKNRNKIKVMYPNFK